MSKPTKQEKLQAIADLRELVKPGDTVYTILKHVSRSGMSRVIDVYVMKDNAPCRISWDVAIATEHSYNRNHEGVSVGGCGMDMGFHLVYSLSYALYGKDFECIGYADKRAMSCPSNDHFNGDKDYTPHKHSDGGYALRQRWM